MHRLFVLLLLLPSLALAHNDVTLSNGVLIFYGNGGPSIGQYGDAAVYNQLKSYYDSQGFPATYTDQWPAELSQYRLMIIVAPGLNGDGGQNYFSDSQVSSISSLVQKGGRVVVLGDWGGHFGVRTLNNLLERLGIGIRQNANIVTPDGDIIPPFTGFIEDPITEGVGSLDLSAASDLSLSGTAKALLLTPEGNPFVTPNRVVMAVDQPLGAFPRGIYSGHDVVVISDTQGLDDYAVNDHRGDGQGDWQVLASNLVDLLPPSPVSLKRAAIDELKGISAPAKAKKEIGLAIRDIEFSLKEELWHDAYHPLPDKGKNVLTHEWSAVKRIEGLAGASGAIGKLIEADRTIIDYALRGWQKTASPERMAAAQAEIGQAVQLILQGDFSDAIEHFKRAWINP